MLFDDLPEDYQDIFYEKRLQERLRILLEYEPEAQEPRHKRARLDEEEDDAFTDNDMLYALLIVEARCRHAFKRLLNCWLKSRADKIPLNTNDPITLCPYEQPIILYDMKHRSRHCFEAKQLITNIYHQLRYSFGGFPKPLAPMNPITNLPFNCGQLLQIFDSAMHYGYWSAPFVAFRAAGFDVNQYSYLEERPLRFAAIKEFIYGNNHKNMMIEEMINFIVGAANKRGKYLTGAEIRRLSFAMKKEEHPYVVQWMRIFEDYLKYDLKATPVIRYCPEQIKRSRAISAELHILIPALNGFLEEMKAPYTAFIAQQQLQMNQALEDEGDDEEEEEEVYPDDENDNGTVIFAAGGTIEETFQQLLTRLHAFNNIQRR